jgi:hypothetical protein
MFFSWLYAVLDDGIALVDDGLPLCGRALTPVHERERL